MISNNKFNRRIKRNRWLKVMISWPVMVFMVWLSYSSINELVVINDSIGIIPKAKIAGLMNNIASFVGGYNIWFYSDHSLSYASSINRVVIKNTIFDENRAICCGYYRIELYCLCHMVG